MADKLKIFSDKKWLPANCNHVIMLYPFWGDIPLSDIDPDKGRFDDYIVGGRDCFEIVNSIIECDLVVLPFEYSFDNKKRETATNVARLAKENGKKLIVFFNSDSTVEINLEHSIILRTSFFKSKQRSNEKAFPGWSIDFMKKFQGDKSPITKRPKVKISYCGYVDKLEESKTGLLGKMKSALAPITKENESYGSIIRGKAVRALLKDNTIETDFIIRDGFWAQGITDKLKVRDEYMQNMFSSPYALVTRGAGNFSYRLLEVMSCGRIPVFINTDSVLPMENKINWKKQTVWLEENEIPKIGKVVSDFHNSVSDSYFKELQNQNRKIYEEYLSPTGYFKHFNALV